MSKTKKRNKFREEEDEEGYDPQEYRNKKKEKRLSSALRSKNVDELLNLTDDEYF
jgi:hypothetical protein